MHPSLLKCALLAMIVSKSFKNVIFLAKYSWKPTTALSNSALCRCYWISMHWSTAVEVFPLLSASDPRCFLLHSKQRLCWAALLPALHHSTAAVGWMLCTHLRWETARKKRLLRGRKSSEKAPHRMAWAGRNMKDNSVPNPQPLSWPLTTTCWPWPSNELLIYQTVHPLNPYLSNLEIRM